MKKVASLPPPTEHRVYDKLKRGYIGKLGHGANADVVFLQTAISKAELDDITLIQFIPGSAKWPVRDLFQRDVDNDRVLNDVLPYLQDPTRVKFFNPLTLVMLPMEDDMGQIGRKLETALISDAADGGHKYRVSERDQYFRFKEHLSDPAYSFVEWNSQKVHLVAIDGQHRLSAFKRWKNTPGMTGFDSWRIPVVILGVFKADPKEKAANLLDIVRATFVNINSRAEQVNEAREILLNDESVNAICAQEVVEHAHGNDCRPYGKRQLDTVPLIFFDWRGTVKNNYRVPTAGSLKSVEEIRDWFTWYILGDDRGDEQAAQLGLVDFIPPLKSFGVNLRLSHDDSARIRARIKEDLLPAFLFLLEKFKPFSDYIERAREIEKDAYIEGPDLSRHAFDLIRFGSTTATPDILDGVKQREQELMNEYEEASGEIDQLIRYDIGMRAVVCAYGYGKAVFDDTIGRTSTWVEYAEWFVDGMNSVYEDRWFQSFDDIDDAGREILTQVVFNAAGAIINYKLEVQSQSFGALLLLFIFCKYGDKDVLGKNAQMVCDDARDQFTSNLESTVKKGYAQTFRAELRNYGTPAEIRAEASTRASVAAAEHLERIEAFLEQ